MIPRKPKKPPNKSEGGAEDGTTSDAFGIWLNRSLHQLYDDVAQEPIPPELLRLIEEDRLK